MNFFDLLVSVFRVGLHVFLYTILSLYRHGCAVVKAIRFSNCLLQAQQYRLLRN